MTAKSKRNEDKLVLNNSSITPATQVELYRIAVKMKGHGLADTFIVAAVKVAMKLEGAADLMHLWINEKDAEEKNEIIADLQDLIDASNQEGIIREQYVKFNDLDAIAKDIRAFKDSLYQIVVARGGVSKLSELTGIPQPSLSRFFNSNAMPQRSTVLAIADALKLDGIAIDVKWGRMFDVQENL
jgi:DNA-binding phage protein